MHDWLAVIIAALGGYSIGPVRIGTVTPTSTANTTSTNAAIVTAGHEKPWAPDVQRDRPVATRPEGS